MALATNNHEVVGDIQVRDSGVMVEAVELVNACSAHNPQVSMREDVALAETHRADEDLVLYHLLERTHCVDTLVLRTSKVNQLMECI